MESWIQALAGTFMVFDGPDGSGKSTQFRRFADFCRQHQVPVKEVREPGGTVVGEQIRTILLDPASTDMAVRCEMLLYMASRAQLINQIIRPALAEGQFVLADRFISSTLAYQGAAGGLAIDAILQVGEIAVSGHWPNLTVIFDVDEHVAATRLNPLLDRMEQKGVAYHRRVRQGFLDQAVLKPDQYLVIDASGQPDLVFNALLAGIAARMISA